ncbi:hypothetical protein [Tenacibaculum finnmarkense]|uniref:hypothetical protein n=1 Tax=Tenacibaculum finnmarkense TaxID=2781243 RepID=UPI001E5AA654|nr:hypothetical protein [Tenacibaculum finnmarkense]MCD8413639.1 hypothetical protein [Tenacibaculum finnmarkense genomovar ulcerans]
MTKENTYELGQTYIRFDFTANEEFKIALEKYLLYKGKIYAKEFFNKEFAFDEFYFVVETEEGSLKSRLKIFGQITIGALIAYGGIRTGVDYLIQDSKRITNHIVQDISNEPNINPNSIGRVERRLGVPGKLKRLYDDIHNLENNRDNLTEQDQTNIINRISNRYDNLISELDQPIIEQIQNDLEQKNFYPQIQEFREQNQLPISDDEYNFPRLIAIREDNETLFIGEDEIDGEPNLPQPN